MNALLIRSTALRGQSMVRRTDRRDGVGVEELDGDASWSETTYPAIDPRTGKAIETEKSRVRHIWQKDEEGHRKLKT